MIFLIFLGLAILVSWIFSNFYFITGAAIVLLVVIIVIIGFGAIIEILRYMMGKITAIEHKVFGLEPKKPEKAVPFDYEVENYE